MAQRQTGGWGAKLTPKQQLFVEAYLGVASGNATEAARLAGYAGNDNTLKSVGAENLTKPDIAAAVGAKLEVVKGCLDADAVLTRISTLADDADRDGDKLKALELLGKYHKLFVERVEHSGEVAAKVYQGFDPERV